MNALPCALATAAVLALAPLPAAAQNATADGVEIPGYDELDVSADHRARPIPASIWYPMGSKTYVAPIGRNAIFKGVPAAIGAGVAPGRFPLFLFSHGSGGAMNSSAWLSADLAKRGAMVLAVNHPGSTSGNSSPRRSLRLDKRAADLSAALDALLADPSFADRIDRTRIYAMGFSLGGATALNLAGVRFDGDAYGDICADDDGSRMDCVFFAKGGVDFSKLPDGFSADGSDPRVTAAVAIDPAFTEAATDDSVAAVRVPIALINLGDAHRSPAADVSENGSGFAARLPNAAFRRIAPANHFTFLAECQPAATQILAEEDDDPICTDPPATDRAATHRAIATAVAAFAGL